MGQMIDFPRPDGGNVRSYLAGAEPGRPGVVVIQEWWGLNDQICGVVDRFARAGFTVLAPDLFQGRVTQEPDEAKHLMTGLDFPGATHQDIRGAVLQLKRQCGKVGVMGFCMGGALTVAAAVHVPETTAAVCFYGMPPKEFADPAKIRIPFQAHFAIDDDWCTPKAVDDMERSMREAGSAPEFFRYPAGHGFFNERRGVVYDADCATQAWDRMLAFWAKTL